MYIVDNSDSYNYEFDKINHCFSVNMLNFYVYVCMYVCRTLPEQTFVTSDSFQYQAMNGGKENGSGHHHPVTLAHLAHTLPQ